MSGLIVRRLNIDLSHGFPGIWIANDAFRTQVFNATSMFFPIGEQYFIDTVRLALPFIKDPALVEQVKSFIGQEASHRHIHEQFNAELRRQGLRDIAVPFIAWRIRISQRLSLKSKLAITIANEHFTAVFAEGVLSEPSWIDGAVEPLKTLWTWHSVEEIEHKSVAFDVYGAMGGGYWLRVGWFLYVGALFSLDMAIQVTHNLYSDKQLFKFRTLVSAIKFYGGRHGLIRQTFGHWLAYFNPNFTPWQHDNRVLTTRWLGANRSAYREVGKATVASGKAS